MSTTAQTTRTPLSVETKPQRRCISGFYGIVVVKLKNGCENLLK